MDDSFYDKAHKIGFNNAVARNSRTFQIQTEVVGRGQLVIRTTVLEGGVVRLSDSSEFSKRSDEIQAVHLAAEAQHRAHVNRVERGELD